MNKTKYVVILRPNSPEARVLKIKNNELGVFSTVDEAVKYTLHKTGIRDFTIVQKVDWIAEDPESINKHQTIKPQRISISPSPQGKTRALEIIKWQ